MATYRWDPPLERLRTPCSVDDCTRPVKDRGLCSAHAWRLRHHGSVDATRPIQTKGHPTDPLVCVCAVPAPDGIGECQNRWCHRPWFSPEYVQHLREMTAAGRFER